MCVRSMRARACGYTYPVSRRKFYLRPFFLLLKTIIVELERTLCEVAQVGATGANARPGGARAARSCACAAAAVCSSVGGNQTE
eukprot:5811122-Pleurochrysis_carterae.AAC.1